MGPHTDDAAAAISRWQATVAARLGAGRRVGFAPLVVAPRHHMRDGRTRRLLTAADAASVLGAMAAMALVGAGWEAAAWSTLTLPGWIVVFRCYGLYDRSTKRLTANTVDDLPWMVHATLVAAVALWVYHNETAVPDVSFGNALRCAAFVLAAMTVLRVLVKRVVASTLGPERVLLVGDGVELASLAHKLRAHPEYGAEPVGFLSRTDWPADEAGLPLLGRRLESELDVIVRRERIERVIVAHCDIGEDALMDVLRRLRQLGVKASVVPRLFDVMGPSVEVDVVEGVTTLNVVPPVFTRSSRILKRGMDVIGAGILLVVAAPLMLACALAVWVDSPGGVLFRQQRIGRGGRPFRLLKFRTMVTDAERLHADLLARSDDPGWLHLDTADPRVTRVGRFLRMSSLDELPQLWNVLRGEMSLVGPRPLIASEDGRLEGWRRSRVDLTPGLTGLWQVLGRTRIPFEEMVKLDYLYVTNWSLWTDIRLLLRTLPAVLGRRGAN